VANLGLLKPGHVVAQVKARVPFPFAVADHVRAWQHYTVRPKGGSDVPEKTKAKYCVYDTAHHDYVYTQDWVEFLCKELSLSETYATVTGKEAPAVAAQ
jgi:hypothetical protein